MLVTCSEDIAKWKFMGTKRLQRRMGPFCAGWSCVWWASWTIMQPTPFLVKLRVRGCWAPMMCHPHRISLEDAPDTCNALQASQDRTHPLSLSPHIHLTHWSQLRDPRGQRTWTRLPLFPDSNSLETCMGHL